MITGSVSVNNTINSNKDYHLTLDKSGIYPIREKLKVEAWAKS